MASRHDEMAAAIARAEELDALEEEREEDYVHVQPPRDPAQVYSIRIPSDRIEQLRRVARDRGTRPSTLIRDWVLQKLDDEGRGAAAGSTTINVVLQPTTKRDVVLGKFGDVLAVLDAAERENRIAQ